MGRDGEPRLTAAQGQPGQPAAGLVHRHQQVEQRRQFGTDAADAVVQGVVGNDGQPLKIHRSRIRTTHEAMRDKSTWTGSARATIDPNRTPASNAITT
ncbi:hypothetical protein [Streptomyces sp. NPDC048527]|uniref:hypothetical protein n=1 Tax=Streptomyces sp. NPDC048527 TaxID=3365568 RepID=UPI0037223F7C